ncbi:MAG: PQQ-like beta-propeller repeat protein [Candidatus Thorarchaeota archaeon]|nr:PQQ-like beta-propeller repeat protein [Candidatus Thorarchaeota archaeon]
MRGGIVSILAVVMISATMISFLAENTGADNSGSDDVWPVLGGDPQHTGQSQFDTSDNKGGVVWSMTQTSMWPSVAIDDDGMIYAPITGIGLSGYLLAINPNGTVNWTFHTGGYVETCPVITEDGSIYFGSHDGNFYALFPNGTEKWRASYNSPDVYSPVMDDQGLIYFLAHGKLHCLDQHGNEHWNFSAHSIDPMTPALSHHGEIILGTSEGILYCVYPNGTLRWSSEVGEEIAGTISIDSNGNIYCIDRGADALLSVDSEGQLRWSYPIVYGTHGASIGIDGTVYCGEGYNLVALDSNGSLIWKYATGGTISSPPAISLNGNIFFGSQDGNVYALDQSGEEVWIFDGNDWVESRPAIGSDGTVYIGSHGGILYAFNGLPDPSPTLIAGAVSALIIGVILAIWAAYPKRKS